MSVEANVQKMIDDLNSALVDAVKHDKGNSAAGTRGRKAMQAIKADAQGVRKQVQNDKNNWVKNNSLLDSNIHSSALEWIRSY